jgi:hypothetical protein
MRSAVSTLVAVVALATVLSGARAQEVSVWGTGQESCGKWLAQRTNNVNRTILHNWILGFISGSNWYSRSQARPPDSDAVATFVDQYCQNNPLHLMALAAAALVGELGGPKATHEWKR